MTTLHFDKSADGLLPAVVQDAVTRQVLMLGYMNQAAYEKTLAEGVVTFYSRSRQTLWTKGETSGNFLRVVSLRADCDGDTLLVRATPDGPTCHTGADTCFDEVNAGRGAFLNQLQGIVRARKTATAETSYTASLFAKGLNKIAQKVGEEAVEVVIEAKDQDDARFKNETADLLFHLMVLLEAKNTDLDEVIRVLEDRHGARKGGE